MHDDQQLDAVANRLKSYQGQIEALANALDALRDLAGSLAAEMASEAELVGACRMAARSSPMVDVIADVTPAVASSVAASAADDELPQAAAEIIAIDPVTIPLDGTEIVVSTFDAPLPAETQAALEQVSKLAIEEKAMTPSLTATGEEIVGTKPVAARTRVLDFASRVKSARSTPLRHKVAGAVASVMLMISATAGVHGFLHTDMGQRLLELGSCDADVSQPNSDCAFLGWLLL